MTLNLMIKFSMNFKIVTIFPEFFESALNFSLLKRAKENNLLSFKIFNLRDWAKPKTVHRQIDDRPYGGGPGMLMMVEPLYKAIKEVKTKENKKTATIIFSPHGKKYDQVMAQNLAQNYDELILIAPHYEGFDARILNYIDYEICMGDYVLTGGEIPTLTVIDSVARLLPGVLGNEESSQLESFSELQNGTRNLEHRQYTRPEVFIDDEGKEHKVPPVLLSGHHKEIEKYKQESER
jgi:tRNA (guanine37-N1)-methyltransferase